MADGSGFSGVAVQEFRSLGFMGFMGFRRVGESLGLRFFEGFGLTPVYVCERIA